MIQFNFSSAKKIIYFLALATVIFQLFDSRMDYSFIQGNFTKWDIHHDEKLIVPDARFFFQKNISTETFIDDFQPPISACFGVGGPFLANLGFKIFGLNNVGLRFFFIIISGITTLFTLLIIFEISPGIIGIFFSIFYLTSYNNFILNRLAILENILTFFLSFILWLYFSKREFLIKKIPWFFLISGATLFFKPNFFFYFVLLLISISIVEFKDFQIVIKHLLLGFLSLIFFEMFHFFILWILGISKWRYFNLWLSLAVQSGTSTPLLQSFEPIFFNTFLIFPLIFFEWFGVSSSLPPYSIKFVMLGSEVVLVCVFIYLLIWKKVPSISNYFLTLLFYNFSFLCLASFLAFFVKRGLCIFVPAFILLSGSSFWFYKALIEKFPGCKKFVGFAFGFIIILRLLSQWALLNREMVFRSNGVEMNSKILETSLPKDEKVFLHCYGFRFLWQNTKQRLISFDDQLLNNQGILIIAVKNRAKYVILSNRGGNVDFSKTGIKEDILRRSRCIAEFHFNSADSDVPDKCLLYEIFY